MSDTDQITYGRRERLRLALADQAADIADSARGMVTTYADGYVNAGEFVEMACRIAADARELLSLAVVYERRRGTSWEVVGETLGISRQAAHERYASIEKQVDTDVTECWLLGDDPRFPGLPEAASDPGAGAVRLDRWVSDRMVSTDPLAHKDPADPARTHPVSGQLAPLSTLEHSSLVTAAAVLLSERRRRYGLGGTRTRELELGFARRKVQLYERMIADETGEPGRSGTPVDDLRALLTGARARLAELTQAAVVSCVCAPGRCSRGEFRDHQGDSPGCMACADLDPEQPCYAAVDQPGPGGKG
jgi:hypothetical protein